MKNIDILMDLDFGLDFKTTYTEKVCKHDSVQPYAPGRAWGCHY